jgi:hypothetical protein
MVRLPRLVISGLALSRHQPRNRRAPTFFEDGDYALYRDLLGGAAAWIASIGAHTARQLAPQKRGPKLKSHISGI